MTTKAKKTKRRSVPAKSNTGRNTYRNIGQKPKKFLYRWQQASAVTRAFSFVAVFSVVGVALLAFALADGGQGWKSFDAAQKDGLISARVPILEVSLQYNQASDPAVTFDKVTRKNGYVPQSEPIETGWKLEIVNNAQEVMDSQYLIIPTEVNAPPPLNKDTKTVKPPELTQIDFAVTLRWPETGAQIVLKDPSGRIVATKDLKRAPKEEKAPNFKSIRGNEAVKDAKLSLSNLFPAQKIAAQSAGTLDITFIGDDYSAGSLSQFQADVTRTMNHLLAYEPFRARASQIVFHYVNNTTDLGCAYGTGGMDRLLTCNNSLVTQAVNSAGAPYDKVIVLVNNATYGGSGGAIAVSYNGTVGPQVATHEFGHSFGALHDEYVLYGSNGVSDNKVYNNCYAGAPPATAWSTVVPAPIYTLGCNFPNWYSSTPTSIMREIDKVYFNAVSQKQLNQKLDYFTSQSGNTTPPTGSSDIIAPIVTVSAPASGTSIGSKVTINANATDNVKVSSMEIFIDGTRIRTVTGSSVSYAWNTRKVSKGNHTILVKAYDAAGNIGQSSVIVTK